MSALVKSLGDFVKVLIEAFNFSSIFPATVLVILFQLYILPMLPNGSLKTMIVSWDAQTQTGMGILAVALISYLLGAANIQIIRWLEGYPWRNWPLLKRLTQGKTKYVSDTMDLVREYEQALVALKQEHDATQDLKIKKQLRKLAGKVRQNERILIRGMYGYFPQNHERTLPTSLGNVIAASEEYPNRILGMDSVVLWPFLIPTLTEKNYAQHLVREKAAMDFLANLVVVMVVFGVLLCIVMIRYYEPTWELAAQLCLIALVCWFLYRLAVQGAAGWGSMIRAAFVLFRSDLRSALGLRCPVDYSDEFRLWRQTSDFLRADPADMQHIGDLGKSIF